MMDDEEKAGSDMDQSGMGNESFVLETSSPRPLRLAVVGCGHGTLDAIYASVEKTCEVQKWDGVDLVIINGDFQAVRHHQDLNVTAMPPKYRDLADFHRYYYGDKTAPYLTIFIGGNHEASNHLFELFYGGWVAPNIYYLGVANVIKFHGLKIAGLSGIYKHHDYKKPHFERLPYNNDTMRSIFHQRELDVRKLLAYRTQVEIGLSHDWPRGIVMLGNYKQLFAYKPFFAEEARDGSLGSPAAELVMDRLRPPYWFSAHLHARYAAVKTYENVSAVMVTAEEIPEKSQEEKKNDTPIVSVASNPSVRSTDPSVRLRQVRPEDAAALSGWTSFSQTVQAQDRDDGEESCRQLQLEREERERSGQQNSLPYTFEETFKEVKVSNIDGVLDRQAVINSASHLRRIPQYDGCCASVPTPFKRQRLSSGEDDDRTPVFRPQQTDGSASPNQIAHSTAIRNPDAIDVSMSDSEEDETTPTVDTVNEDTTAFSGGFSQSGVSARLAENGTANQYFTPFRPVLVESVPQTETHLTRQVNGSGSDSQDRAVYRYVPESVEPVQSDIRAPNADEVSANDGLQKETTDKTNGTTVTNDDASSQQDQAGNNEEVSDEVRNQLAKLSATFAPEAEAKSQSPTLPFPSDTITNKSVKFLALSKAEQGQNFLQLIEIPNTTVEYDQIPAFEYDPEWLAITRVFHSELQLGGTRQNKAPPHRGDQYYRDRIIEEEAWVQSNIVEKNLLKVPSNFTITSTGDHDPANTGVDPGMPREVTNPQTVRFCDVVGIDNPFDITEQERDERIATGPPPEHVNSHSRGSWGRGRGRGDRSSTHGGFSSHHNDGGGRGGRGRSKGRGRYSDGR